MRVIISLAIVALASARPMGDVGGGDYTDIDKLWGVVDGMVGGQQKKADDYSDIGKLWDALAGMQGKEGTAKEDKDKGVDDWLKALMGGMEQKKEEKVGTDKLWEALSGMHDKKKGGYGGDDKDMADVLKLLAGIVGKKNYDDKGEKGRDMRMGDDKEEQMKKIIEMTIKQKLEMGDLQGAMALMAFAKNMSKGQGMNEEDAALKAKIFKIMVLHQMVNEDFDGVMKLMIMHKKYMSEKVGKALSSEEVDEYAKKVYNMIVQHKMESNDQEGLKRLLLWHKAKMEQKSNGGVDDEMEVKAMFMQLIAMHKMEKGDTEGLRKIMDWVRRKEADRASGKNFEDIKMALFMLAKAKGGYKNKEDMEKELPKAMMLIDKLEKFREDKEHHQFLHLVDKSLGEKSGPDGGGDNLEGMLKKLLGYD